MTVSFVCTAYSRKEVAMNVSGLPSGAKCSFYRCTDLLPTSDPGGGAAWCGNRDWTNEEKIAENLDSTNSGTCVKHCYDARDSVVGDWYYLKITDGNDSSWMASGSRINTSTLAEELKDDYTAQTLNVATTQQAIVTIQNNSGAVNFSSVPLSGGKKIAVVILQKNEIQGESYTDFSDSELAAIFYNSSDKYKFQLVSTASTENISGKTPALSGYLKLNYNNTGAQ